SNGANCFFFQAEDGIRDKLVTGVQTCALPISLSVEMPAPVSTVTADDCRTQPATLATSPRDTDTAPDATSGTGTAPARAVAGTRSEERRVGKEGRAGGWPAQ